jgi:hypothetical protein
VLVIASQKNHEKKKKADLAALSPLFSDYPPFASGRQLVCLQFDAPIFPGSNRS